MRRTFNEIADGAPRAELTPEHAHPGVMLWDLGELERGDALRGGAIEVRGSRTLARALPSWKRQLDNAAERGSPS